MLIGIVGKANVGKSTFFKAMTLADIEIANYPFATIKPNHGIGFVKIDCVDKEFNTQCNPREGFCIEHKRFVPVELVDVAGLVPGAHEGRGMGNQFLDDLRPADVLIHVVDMAGSTDENGEPIKPGSYDPAKDVLFLEQEIDFWYHGILKKGWDKFARTIQQEKKKINEALAKQLSGLGVSDELVEETLKKLKLDSNPTAWSDSDLMLLAKELRKETKPIIIAANKIDVPEAYENMKRIQEQFKNSAFVPVSAECELVLKEAWKGGFINYISGEDHFEITEKGEKEMNESQKNALEFIKKNILEKYKSTGVQECINRAVFDVLEMIAIFPGGTKKLEDSKGRTLPDCFLIKNGSTALDFAYKIHSDLGRGFIKAIDVKKRRDIGKEHILKNLDVVEIISSIR